MARLYHGKDDLSMAIRTYLAMTAAEFAAADPLPPHIAWMACHFSPYGSGLSNLPASLPPGSLLILNDRIPPRRHDPLRIAQQLQQAAEALDCSCILLDFQQPDCEETADLAKHLISALPRPVAVSSLYAQGLDCPVFLPPCPHHIALENHIAPWQGREIWLDLAVDAETITLTQKKAVTLPLPLGEIPRNGHSDESLHCHYSTETSVDSIRFSLWRTNEDLKKLSLEAEMLGITALVALFQESV